MMSPLALSTYELYEGGTLRGLVWAACYAVEALIKLNYGQGFNIGVSELTGFLANADINAFYDYLIRVNNSKLWVIILFDLQSARVWRTTLAESSTLITGINLYLAKWIPLKNMVLLQKILTPLHIFEKKLLIF